MRTMKYVLFVSDKDHADFLQKDHFKGYDAEKRAEGDLTILTYKVSKDENEQFLKLYELIKKPSNNGIKVHGVTLPF